MLHLNEKYNEVLEMWKKLTISPFINSVTQGIQKFSAGLKT